MAVIKDATKYSIQIVYKPSYDQTGTLTLPSISKTFNKVSESATPQQLFNFANALMSLTIYREAPYRINLIDTSELLLDD